MKTMTITTACRAAGGIFALAFAIAAAQAIDFNSDSVIDIDDCAGLAARIAAGARVDASFDLNHDGVVDMGDALLYGQWANGLWQDRAAGFAPLPFRDVIDTAAFQEYQRTIASNKVAVSAASLRSAYPDPAAHGDLNYSAASVLMAGVVGTYFNDSAYLGRVLRTGVAIDNARQFPNFYEAFADIHTNDLPVIFTTDAMLNALLRSFDNILMTIEMNSLFLSIKDILVTSIGYCDRTYGGETGGDVRVFLLTALALLDETAVTPADRALVNDNLTAVSTQQTGTATLFGVPRSVDFSQFKPRGHYADISDARWADLMKRYFQCVMWLSRVDLGLTLDGQGTPPRMKKGALALWDCVVNSGCYADWLRIDRLIEYMVGSSDGMSMRTMGSFVSDLRFKSIPAAIASFDEKAFDSTLAAHGYGMQAILSRAQAFGGVVDSLGLPRVFTFLPQRFVLDSYAFSQLVYPLTTLMMPSALDVAFVLGDNGALADDPSLTSQNVAGVLASQRKLFDRITPAGWHSNLYLSVLNLLRTLNTEKMQASTSPVFRSAAWETKMRNTQLAGWAQLRAATLLYAKQSYAGGSCSYPEAMVEPYPAFFREIVALAQSAGKFLKPYSGDAAAYFQGVEEISAKLAPMAEASAAGHHLTDEQTAWLKTIVTGASDVQSAPASLGYVARVYDGWYFDLVFNAVGSRLPASYTKTDGTQGTIREFYPPSFGPGQSSFTEKSYVTIADVHTVPPVEQAAQVFHAATGFIKLMTVVVKLDSCTSVYVGPVGSYYDVTTTGAEPVRLDKGEWLSRLLSATPPAQPAWMDSVLAK